MLAWNPPEEATKTLARTVSRESPARDDRLADGGAVHPQFLHLAVVGDLDPDLLRPGVQRVHQRLAAAQEERVGAREIERAAERGLEANAAPFEKFQRLGRGADRQAGEVLVGLAACHAQQILPVFLFGIGVGQDRSRADVHGAEVARVPAVAAAEGSWGMFQQQHAAAGLSCRDRGTQGGIAAAHDENVEHSRQIKHELARRKLERSARSPEDREGPFG